MILEIISFVCLSHLSVLFFFLIFKAKSLNIYAVSILSLITLIILPLSLKYQFPKGLILVFLIGVISIPFLYWLISLELSKKKFQVKSIHWLILTFKILISLFFLRGDPNYFLLSSIYKIKGEFYFILPPAIFSTILLGLGFYNLIINLKHDLVESSKKIRLAILLLTGFSFFIIVILRIILHEKSLEQYLFISIHSIVLLSAYFLTFTCLKLRDSIFFELTKTNIKSFAIDKELLEKLKIAFEVEKYFKEEGLTIRKLAVHMNVQEHQLRKLINLGLGYKNFNEYLNHFRIMEACEILKREKKINMPIIRIAMDLGYKSLASFNKAFKEISGVTPSEYREINKNTNEFRNT